ncbi:zinc-binding dehydrogenase [Cnuibacter physcomitrellae]|uniref:zinc-binding dehydrogenase n=1 Tax=Cnuibacter physcomitrellae TaxID=1619308 RepID=UPI002175DD2D|nr:zinc-binding dehydrogenase [Cnuibacter physcomitrellae]MCS5495849.1 zinc-binding dehydrogenase [Cnuibacter physcomitrellae]
MTAGRPDSMRAAIWNGGSPELVIETIPVPTPARGEALLRVAACGVCHTDLHVMKAEVAFPPPAVVGHEVSGTIVEIGPGSTPTDLRPGQRVVGAFIMPCTECEACRAGRDDMCEAFFEQNRLKGNLFDGTTRLHRPDGSRLSMYSMAGLAEYAVVPLSALAPLPPGVSFEEAAVLGCAAFTAYGAAAKAELAAGESMAIVATGGVGSSLIQVGRYLGASPIIAIDIDDDKLAAASALGADVVINSAREDVLDRVREATGGKGVSVAFEALGRPQTFELAVSLLREGGRMVAVGIAAGAATAAVPITPLVRRGQVVMGSFGARTRRDLPRVIEMAASGGYDVDRAVTRRYSLEHAGDAYAALDRGEISGRAIVTMAH